MIIVEQEGKRKRKRQPLIIHYLFILDIDPLNRVNGNGKKRRREQEKTRRSQAIPAWWVLMCDLGDSVSAVNTQVCAGDIAGSIRQQEGHGTHQIGRLTHLALRNERDPLLLEVGVLVEDLLGAIILLFCLVSILSA